jgi:hypothetical protein
MQAWQIIVTIASSIITLGGAIAVIEYRIKKAAQKVQERKDSYYEDKFLELRKKTDVEYISPLIDEKMKRLENVLDHIITTEVLILSQKIKGIYHDCRKAKQISHYQLEYALDLHAQYEKLGGNGYLDEVITKIKAFEIKE